MIEQVPAISPDVARHFIRFGVNWIPPYHDPETFELCPAYWAFRVDMMVGGQQFHVDWRQPDQKKEPAPDPRAFFPALAALLNSAEDRA